MNSKGEWGVNIVPQLKPTEDGELTSDQSQSQKKLKPLVLVPKHENVSDTQTEFNEQFSQRKKRRRQAKEQDLDQGQPGQPQEEPGQQLQDSQFFQTSMWTAKAKNNACTKSDTYADVTYKDQISS